MFVAAGHWIWFWGRSKAAIDDKPVGFGRKPAQ
jgi:hypothetical protein